MLGREDIEIARGRLGEFEDLCVEWFAAPGGSIREQQLDRLLLKRKPVIDAIFNRLDLQVGEAVHWQSSYKAACPMALGMLEDQDLISRLEHGTGPQLGAPSLHPWVWSAAAGLWNGGHFREAVAAAGASVTAQVQSKVGRWDLADADLLNQVLSRQPAKPGEPRLRVPGDQGNRFTMALQEGLLKLAGGLYAVVRNPATHETQQWEEQLALEQLAALSVLARRLDDAEVVNDSSSVPPVD